jgi:hypothetical protein
MSTEEYSDAFFKGPAYALVIGISKYEHGREPDQELAPDEFPNLRLAAKDAEDFANFLKNYGFIEYQVESLLNEEASRANIIDQLDKMRMYCQQPGNKDPLVIVYFSGHGWADAEGRHYLIPYDARRDRLRSTAFLNKDFSEYLNDLQTNRLVVFLDACHAGAMGMEGVKGALPQYNPSNLGEGEGRYLIASCGPGQKSYEWEEKQNSIFTGHLLELLKCETEEIDKEEIDIFTLYPVLRDKVKTTAFAKYQQEQEPISEIKGGRGIILAINQRIRDKRILKDEQVLEERHKFLLMICDRIMEVQPPGRFMIKSKLEWYVKGEKEAGHENFYGLFDDYFDFWKKAPDDSRIHECCKFLIQAHETILNSKLRDKSTTPNQVIQIQETALNSALVSKESPSQEPPKPVDKFDSTPESKVVGVEKPKAPVAPPPSLDRKQQPRRQLSPEDCDYVLEEIKVMRYFSEWRTLSDSLGQPISEKEFDKKIFSIMESKKDNDDLRGIVKTIMDRFQERWPRGKEVKPKTLSSFMMEEGKRTIDEGKRESEDQARQIKSELPVRPSKQPSDESRSDVPSASIEDESSPTERTGVFISYSHKDKKWLTELQTMLTPLVRSGAIKLWDDTKIQPGALWQKEIKKALASTKVAVLLVSANFLASEFIANNELPPLLKAAEDEGVIVYWIYVSSCMYEATEIKHYQAAHDLTRPLDRMSKPDRQAVLSEVCAQIETLIH